MKKTLDFIGLAFFASMPLLLVLLLTGAAGPPPSGGGTGGATNGFVGTNWFIPYTNGVLVKPNGNILRWPVLLTNSATVTLATNADGSLYWTATGSAGLTNTFNVAQFTPVNGTNMNLATSVALTNATYVGLYGNTNLQTVASAATNWLIDLSSNQFVTIPSISNNVNIILTNITPGANLAVRVVGSQTAQYTVSLPTSGLLLCNTSTNQLNTNKIGLVTITSFGTVLSNVFIGWTATP